MTTMSLINEILEENYTNVREFLQYGVDLNQMDEYGFTPLIEAAIVDNTDIVKLLLEHGADVNLPDMTGGTALHWAAENNNMVLCELLLKHGANPNAYTFAGQPVLVMPILRQQQALKKLLQHYGADFNFAQDFINTKLLGHMFELVGTASLVDTKNDYVEIDFEGFFLEVSLGMIRDSLAQFNNHFAARRLRHFSELSQITVNALDNAARLIKFQQYRTPLHKHQREIDDLVRKEPLIIPVAYEGHAITFLKLGSILAKCDRREDSRLYDNIVFFHVTNMRQFTPDLVKQLIYERSSDEFINEGLPQLLGLQPITELKIEAQISGNCSWANVEAAIPTMFFMLLLASTEDSKKLPQNKSLALDFFRKWREWNKDRTLYFCIQSFKQGDMIRNACRAEILAAILFQRCQSQSLADRPRIESILSVLIQPQYKHVLDNYVKTYIFESLSEEGKQFGQMLREYGIL